MLDPDNLKLLGCAPPDLNYQVLKVGKPGAIFYPGEVATFPIQGTRKDAPLTSITIGVQEVSRRQGKLYDQKPTGWSMTPPPVVDVLGQRETVARPRRSKFDQGAVEGGKCVVKRTGNVTNYEIAIPFSELKEWKPQPVTTFGFTFRVNKASGPALVFGENKSSTKTNGLTLHPHWSGQPSCTIQWTLGN